MMKAHNYASLAYKILGLYIIFQVISDLASIPIYFGYFGLSPTETIPPIPIIITAGLTILGSFVIGAFLIIKSNRLADMIFPNDVENNSRPMTLSGLMRVGFGFIGLIVISESLSTLSTTIGYFYTRSEFLRELASQNNGLTRLLNLNPSSIDAGNIANLIEAVILIAIGLFLVFWSGLLVNHLNRPAVTEEEAVETISKS